MVHMDSMSSWHQLASTAEYFRLSQHNMFGSAGSDQHPPPLSEPTHHQVVIGWQTPLLPGCLSHVAIADDIVGIWSVWHSGGWLLWGLNTKGCKVPGPTTHQLVISNQWGNEEELPAEVDCGIIAIQCDSVMVIVRFTVIFTVCCMLDTVTTSPAVSCTWDDGTI